MSNLKMVIKKPFVSIITTCKKGASDLQHLKKALAKQTYKNFEFIVTHDRKIPEGWNSGVKKARGEIIVFTETDCVPREDWLEELVKEINKAKTDTILLGASAQSNFNMSSVCLRKKDFLPFDEKLPLREDTEWFGRMQAKKKKIIKLNQKGVVEHKRTRRTVKRRIIDIFLSGYYVQKFFRLYKENAIGKPARFFLSYCFNILLYLIGLLGLLLGFIRWRLLPLKKK